MLVSMFNYLRVRLASKKGQGMVEYGLIIGLIAVLIVGALTIFRDNLSALFTQISSVITGTTGDITTP